ncbi:MAG: bacterial Ig-like domain-containing protein [Paludibacteraceae bacterium]|nr:bacterial Ig-like domain-containing protein [Paludibacteraceae bacterium]
MRKIFSFLLLTTLLLIGGKAWGTDTFKKVTSDSEIADGNKYILVCESKNVAMKVYSSGTKCDAVSITISNNKVAAVTDINVLTLEQGTNGWYFKQENGNYLYSSAAKNLKAENTTNKTLCTITADYQITMGSNGRLQYNAGSPRFCPYTSNQTVAVLYVKEEVSELSSIAISGTYPTTFHTGDAFSYEGMTVTATYADASTQDVTANATFSGYDMDNAGEQTVTVSYTENEVTKTATYDITVNAPATLSSITLSGTYPTEFTQGDAFSSEGIVVTANWSDATTSIVTSDAEFAGYNMSATGEQTVTVSYGDKTATYTIMVNAYVQPTEVTVNMNYTWLGSNNGSNLSSSQLPVVKEEENVTITITDGTSTRPRGDANYIRVYKGSTIKFEAPTGYYITEIAFTTGGTGTWNEPSCDDEGSFDEKIWTGEDLTEVTFSLSGTCFIASVAITLEANTPKVLSSIALSGEYPTTFHTGDAFSHEGMTVTANYEGGKTKDVTASATFSGYDMANAGVQTVTVSYTENEVTKTATYNITVNAPATLTTISLSGTYPTTFLEDDEFSSEGIIVTANYDDDTHVDVTEYASFSGYDMSATGVQTITVSYDEKSVTYNITVNPIPVKSIADFIADEGGKCYLIGIVSNIANTTYGNYDLVDASGSIYVYGTLNTEGATKQFSTLDIEEGDVIKVLATTYQLYGSKDEAINVKFVEEYDYTPFTLGTNGWSTFAADFAYEVSGATAYKAAYSAGVVTLTEVTVVEAGQGIVLKGENAGDAVTITPSAAEASDFADNDLVGVVTAETAPTGAYAIATLVDDGDEVATTKFYPCAGVTVPAHKAYLNTGAATAPSLRIVFAENNTTDIKNLDANENAVKFFENGKLFILRDGVVYDAMGKMVR